MHGFDTFLGTDIITWFATYGYLILIFFFIIEGTIIGFVAGVFSALGFFNPFIVFGLYFVIKVATDSVLYYMSFHGTKFLERFKFIKKLIHKIHDEEANHSKWVAFFRTHVAKILFMAKAAPMPYLPEAIIITSGVLRASTRKTYAGMVLGQLFWSASIIALGYFYGDVLTVTDVKSLFRSAALATVLVVTVGLFYYHYMHDYVIKKFGFSFLFDKNGEEILKE